MNQKPQPETTIDLLPQNDWARTFLQAYADPESLGTISKAAKKAGVTRQTVHNRLKDDLIFKTLYEQAQEELKDIIRKEVMRRAIEPYERPIFQRGELIGHVKEYDNRHLQWVAERLMRDEFHLPTIIELTNEVTGAAFVFRMGETENELEPQTLELEATDEDPENN